MFMYICARRDGLESFSALNSVKAFGWDRSQGTAQTRPGASAGSVPPLCPSSRSGRKVTRSSVRRELHRVEYWCHSNMESTQPVILYRVLCYMQADRYNIRQSCPKQG